MSVLVAAAIRAMALDLAPQLLACGALVMSMGTTAATVVAIVALCLDFLRERRLEERTQDQLDDHEQRLRAIERPS